MSGRRRTRLLGGGGGEYGLIYTVFLTIGFGQAPRPGAMRTSLLRFFKTQNKAPRAPLTPKASLLLSLTLSCPLEAEYDLIYFKVVYVKIWPMLDFRIDILSWEPRIRHKSHFGKICECVFLGVDRPSIMIMWMIRKYINCGKYLEHATSKKHGFCSIHIHLHTMLYNIISLLVYGSIDIRNNVSQKSLVPIVVGWDGRVQGEGGITFSIKMAQCLICFSACSRHYVSSCFISFREYDC
jgi:hypothetical protein